MVPNPHNNLCLIISNFPFIIIVVHTNFHYPFLIHHHINFLTHMFPDIFFLAQLPSVLHRNHIDLMVVLIAESLMRMNIYIEYEIKLHIFYILFCLNMSKINKSKKRNRKFLKGSSQFHTCLTGRD